MTTIAGKGNVARTTRDRGTHARTRALDAGHAVRVAAGAALGIALAGSVMAPSAGATRPLHRSCQQVTPDGPCGMNLDAAWKRFREDPEWLKLRATPGYTDADMMSNISDLVLTPTPYSQI